MKEFFARLNPMERRFVVGVAFAFFLVANIVWVWPHFGDWWTTQAEMNDAKGRVALFDGGIRQIPALKRDIAKYQHQGEVVPQEEQAVQFFRLIQNQSSSSGVAILGMTSQRQSLSTNNPYFVEQNQTLNTQSGEKQLVDFLYNLGAGSSLIRVKALSVSPDQPHQQLAARMTLIASYQRKTPAPGARAAAPAAAKTPAAAAPKPAPAPAGAGPKPTAPNPAGAAKPTPPGTAPRPTLPVPMGHPQPTNKPNPLTPNKK